MRRKRARGLTLQTSTRWSTFGVGLRTGMQFSISLGKLCSCPYYYHNHNHQRKNFLLYNVVVNIISKYYKRYTHPASIFFILTVLPAGRIQNSTLPLKSDWLLVFHLNTAKLYYMYEKGSVRSTRTTAWVTS